MQCCTVRPYSSIQLICKNKPINKKPFRQPISNLPHKSFRSQFFLQQNYKKSSHKLKSCSPHTLDMDKDNDWLTNELTAWQCSGLTRTGSLIIHILNKNELTSTCFLIPSRDHEFYTIQPQFAQQETNLTLKFFCYNFSNNHMLVYYNRNVWV